MGATSEQRHRLKILQNRAIKCDLMAADTLPSDCGAALLAVQGSHVVRGKVHFTSPRAAAPFKPSEDGEAILAL